MKKFFSAALLCAALIGHAQKNDSIMLKKISDEVLKNGECYTNLYQLCTTIGHRLSGSPQAAAAVEWGYQLMKSYNFDTVYLQECWVPHWIRGDKQVGKIIHSKMIGEKEVSICALGGSVPTPVGGLTAEIVEVKSFDELKKLGTAGVKGKIVFYNYPFDVTKINTGEAYGDAVKYRWRGPSEAAKYGAVASVVRSMTTAMQDFPHTGGMGYNDSVPNKIPCCAISTNGAELLSALLAKDKQLKFHMEMNCQTLPDVKSYNVVGELRGSQFPDEIITVGGHLDSWDVGDGAHDDGAGCVQSIEVLRIFKALGIQPKRTIRAVLFMNEENGGKGADKYLELAIKNKEKHLLAIESDAGGFSPRGFGLTMSEEQKKKVKGWSPLFIPYGVYDFDHAGGGADINDLKTIGCALMGLRPDGQRYFDLHHTIADTFDKVNERELKLGAGAMAMMIWLVSEYGL
ncbi:MAG: M20/M25/M40 family metallo-hydrolase [Bacteroidota bacterium]